MYPILIISFFIFIFVYRQYSIKKRMECYRITNGRVIGYRPSSRTLQGLKVQFFKENVEHIIYSDKYHVKLSKGTIVPVLYSCSNAEFSVLLLMPKDFEEYGLQYPDSLKWLNIFINKHKAKKFWE